MALSLVPDGVPFWVRAVTGIGSGVLMGLVVGALTGIALVGLVRADESRWRAP